MSKHAAQINPHKRQLRAYISGFILSLILTFIPYGLVTQDVGGGKLLVVILSLFAVAQLFVQLLFFLHLGREPKPRWNLIAFLFAVNVVIIVVLGSVWIMYNLNYNMMGSPEQKDTYMLEQSSGDL